MPSPRPIQWNDWARPSYASRPIYTEVPNVNTSGFYNLPDIVPPEFRRFGLDPIEDDPRNWGKLDQLKMAGKGLSFGGELFDELYRGDTKNDPRWSIAGVPDLPGMNLLKGTKATVSAAKKASRKAAATKKLEDKAVASVVAESKRPQLKPELGFDPKSAQQRAANSNPLFATVPERMLTSEGPVKTATGATVPAVAMGKPSMPYIRQEMQRSGYLRDPLAPLQLPEPRARFYAGPAGIADAKNPVPFGGGLADITPVKPAPDIPTGLGDFTPPIPPKEPSGLLPSLGRTPWFRGFTGKGKLGKAGRDIEDWTRSVENRLRADSPQGAAIADKYKAYRTDKGVIAGNWESRYNQTIKGIKDDEWQVIQGSLETGTPLTDKRLEGVRRKLVELDDEMIGQAKKYELKLRDAKGKTVPFTPHENYWPHIYPQEFWDNPKNIANALVEKYGLKFDKALEVAENASKHGGKLVLEDERIAKGFAKKFGPQMKSFQRARELNLPGYRTDPDAYRIHIRDMADRIAAKQQFGDLDIAGKPGRDEFATLIKGTKNPEEVQKLLTRVFEREMEHPRGQAAVLPNALLGLSTAKNLSMFAVNNLQQLAALAAQNTPRSLLTTGKSVFKRGERLRRGLESGALQAVHSDAISGMEGATGKLSHYLNEAYGMSRGENFNRSLSAVAGQETAIDLFARLKRGKVSDKVRNRLEELTLTPTNELLAQETLTKKQLDRAGGVMAAKTQGRAQTFDLPYHWTKGTAEPYKNLLLQFKKYPYVQSKLLMDALSQSPVQTAVAGTGAYLLGGEAIGAIKDAKRAAVDAIANDKNLERSWEEQRKKRGDWTDPSRYGKALTEGWMLGLPADIASDIYAGRVGSTFVPPIAEMLTTPANQLIRAKKKGPVAINYLKQWAPFIGRDYAAVTKPKKRGSLPAIPSIKLPEGW